MPYQLPVGAPSSKERLCGHVSSNTVHLPLGAPYRDLERVHGDLVLHGIQRRPSGARGGVADWEALGWPAEGHFRGSNGWLVRMLVVAVDAERGQQDRNDEGEEYGGCDHCAAQLVAQRACGRAHRQGVSSLAGTAPCRSERPHPRSDSRGSMPATPAVLPSCHKYLDGH